MLRVHRGVSVQRGIRVQQESCLCAGWEPRFRVLQNLPFQVVPGSRHGCFSTQKTISSSSKPQGDAGGGSKPRVEGLPGHKIKQDWPSWQREARFIA